MDKRGFTLIELLIVMAIIGILAVVAVTSYIGVSRKAARTEAYSNLESLRLLQEQFFSENGDYAPLGGGQLNGVAAIQAVLPGFRPGTGPQFTYVINHQDGLALPTPVPVPYDNSTVPTVPANTPCFIATATGVAGTRVAGDIFAIDCFNNKNF